MMFLAKILHGQAPTMTEVVGDELVLGPDGKYVRRPRRPKAWKINGGAAALSQTRASAIASAKVVLEQEIFKQRGDDRRCKPKYQRSHLA